MTYLYPPPNEWANIDDCGEFPCTGPNNVLLMFDKIHWSGTVMPLRADSKFQIISGNDENAKNYSNCQKIDLWNAYYCTNDQLAMIVFESLDSDAESRLVSPVTVSSMNLTTRNVLNTFMDHHWDGFYTSFKRLARFPSIIQGGSDMYYNINYAGTPPLS